MLSEFFGKKINGSRTFNAIAVYYGTKLGFYVSFLSTFTTLLTLTIFPGVAL